MLNYPAEKIVFGRRAVLEVLRHRSADIEALIIADGSNLPQTFQSEIDRLGVSPRYVAREEFEKSIHGVHQGIAAVVSLKQFVALETIVEEAKVENGLIVCLDQVKDPQNLGAVLRACEGAGVSGVVVPKRNSAPLSAVARKASAGASELLPLCEVKNLSQTLKRFKKDGFWIVGVSCGENISSIYECELPVPTVLVFGSEGKGMRELTEKNCDILISIPMKGAIESLNISQAVSVVIFELLRRSA